ncbi:MAG: hypothetical protein AAF928_10110 [Myxococcota bacterium]
MIERRLLALFIVAGGFAGGPAACTCSGADGSSDPAAPSPTTNAKGVTLTSVAETCAYKDAWKHKIRSRCTKCISLAKAPKCGCKKDEKAYSGMCASFQNKRLAAKETCDEAWQCSYKCKRGDCACTEACFAGKPECAQLELDVDLCLVDVCEPYCSGDDEKS